MKISIPKEVTGLTGEIRTRRAAIEQHRADIERANEAATKAQQFEADLAALSDKRAKIKAEAFISGKPADLKELDRQEAELESASRRAREDGKAGAMAAEMLQAKITDTEAEIEQLEEQRKAKTLEWLAAQREKAIDRWLDALSALGPIVAEALAFESARRQIVGGHHVEDSLKKAQSAVGAVPRGRATLEERPLNQSQWVQAPIDWIADREHGKREREQLFAELTDAEVL